MVNRVGHLGGAERIILTLTAGLPAFNWAPVIACPADGDLSAAANAQGTEVASCRFDRMRITADPRFLWNYPAAWIKGGRDVARHCRSYGIELLHAHHPVSALYSVRAARALDIPLVLHVHEMLPVPRLYVAAMRVVLHRAAALICVSNVARELALALGAAPERAHVVHNGVDARFFDARPHPRQLPGEGPHIGMFGVLEPHKGQHIFLQGAALIAERFPTARFWVVGGAALKDKEAYAQRLQQMAEAPPLQGRVALVGFQADIAPWLAAMDVVVQTSVKIESFGMAAAEALTLGRPVIASNIGGLPDVVRHGETGLIIPPDNPAALAAALGQLLSSPETRTRFGEKAVPYSRMRFAPEVFCRRTAEIYTDVLDNAMTGSRRQSG